MAYTCQWPCVSDAAPSLSKTVQSAAPVISNSAAPMSFAAALAGASASDDSPYPSPCIKGDTLSIKINQEEYRKGVEDCKYALRARLTLNKGEKPYSARDLSSKISKLWTTMASWKMVPLGKGYYDFIFNSAEDYRKIWAVGTVNLKPGLLRLSQWTKDFKYQTQKQTHVSLWIRLVELPQEYWRERTLKEIASAVGTPIDIDGPTRNRTFGHYARILVDIDLSKKLYDEILVEREDFAFKVEVQYERMPLFCQHCHSIGHNISSCRWLHPQPPKDKNDRGKQIVVADSDPKHPIRQKGSKNDVGPSSGNTSTWVPVPVVSTVTTTLRVPDTATTAPIPTSSVSVSLASPAPLSTSFLDPVSSSLVATSQFDRSNNFSIPLHNVFDLITPREVSHTMPVLEPVSLEAHVDVQSVEAGRSHQTQREELENPVVTNASNTLLDSVQHNHERPMELGESPKVSNERGAYSSPPGREDVRPNGVDQTHQTSRAVLENPVIEDKSATLQDGVEHDHVSPRELEESPKGARDNVPRPFTDTHDGMHEELDDIQEDQENPARVIDVTIENFNGSLEGTVEVPISQIQPLPTETTSSVAVGGSSVTHDQHVVVLQRQEVHPSKNIQHGLDLWERVREYDARSAAEASEGSMQVLTRNQKQKVKVKQVLNQQPSKPRARGDRKPPSQ
jgi:hypothetical protein